MRNNALALALQTKGHFPEKSCLIDLLRAPHEVGIEKQFSSGKS
jgi:hypothetical protein